MTKPSPKKSMLQFLKDIYPEWRSGSALEDYDWGGKKSSTGRALRRLHSEGLLEREYRPLEYRKDEQVFYRWKPPANDGKLYFVRGEAEINPLFKI